MADIDDLAGQAALETLWRQSQVEVQGDPPAETEPAASPPTEQPESTPPAETEPAAKTLVLEALRQRGYEVGEFQDDDTVLDFIAEGWQKVQSAPQSEDITRLKAIEADYARLVREIQQRSQAAPSNQPPPAEPAKPPTKWNAPALSDRARDFMDRGLVGRSEDGKLGVFNTVTNKFEYDVRYEKELREVEDFAQWQVTAQRRLASDLPGAIRDAGVIDLVKQELGLDKLRDSIKEELRAEQRAVAEEQAIKSYFREHQKDFVELDDKGQPKRVKQPDGQEALAFTPRGQICHDLWQDFIDAGMSNYEAFERAVERSARLTPAAPPPKPSGTEKRQAFLTKARTEQKAGQPVNRVFPQAAARGADEPQQFHSLLDAWREAEEEARADV